jgi:AcrR family transcriptional regulator
VDAEQRRGERRETVARATWAVLAREGVRGASVRAVLAEARMSSGAMRYYFRNHDELLVFAAERVLEQSEERIRRRLSDRTLTGRDRVRAVLGEILPLDQTRQTEITVFARLAEVEDEEGRGARARAAAYQGVRLLVELAVSELAGLRGSGYPQTGDEKFHEELVERFHLTLDGLAYQSVLNPGLVVHEEVAAQLDRLIDHVEREVALRAANRPGHGTPGSAPRPGGAG